MNYPHVYSDEVISNLQNNVEDIFANLSAALAIKSDGSIVSWGDDRYGQAIDISNFSDVAQLVSSEYAFAARFTDGTVKVWGHTTNQTNKVSLNHEFDAVDVIDIYPNAGSFALLDVNHNLYLINDTNKQNLTVDIPILSGVKKVVSSFEPENDGSGKNQYFVLLENGDLKQLDVSLKRENFDGFNSNDDIHNIASDVVDFHYIGHNFVKTEKADGSISVSEINPHLFNTISIESRLVIFFLKKKTLMKRLIIHPKS